MKRAKNQITVQLAPAVKDYLTQLVADGEILSAQDFIRRAIEDAILEKADRRIPRRPAASESKNRRE